MLTQTLSCSYCASTDLISNGHAKNGKLRFRCRVCKKHGRQDPGSNAYDEKTRSLIDEKTRSLIDEKTRSLILAAYHERPSLRGISRIFGVSRNTVSAWHKKSGLKKAD